MNTAVHPGGLNATQSLAFFKANGITGKPVKRMRSGRLLVLYKCLGVYIGGDIAPIERKILARVEDHNLEQV